MGLKAISGLAKMILKDLGCRDNAELSILLADNAGIHRLNKRYRNKDKATDVLSFPMGDFNPKTRKGVMPYAPTNPELILGDIVISVESAKAQAKENGVALNQEMTRLLIHGILHLLGFEHEKGGREAQKMRKEEGRLMEEIINWNKIKSS